MIKPLHWLYRGPRYESLSIERILSEMKDRPSYLLKGTKGFAQRASRAAKTSRMVQGLLKRLP